MSHLTSSKQNVTWHMGILSSQWVTMWHQNYEVRHHETEIVLSSIVYCCWNHAVPSASVAGLLSVIGVKSRYLSRIERPSIDLQLEWILLMLTIARASMIQCSPNLCCNITVVWKNLESPANFCNFAVPMAIFAIETWIEYTKSRIFY